MLSRNHHNKACNRTLATGLLAVALVFGGLSSAMATPVNGTDNIVALSTSSSMAHLAIGDVLTNSGVEFGGGGSGDLAAIPIGTAISDTSVTASSGSTYSWTSAVGDFTGLVDGTPVLTTNSAQSSVLSVYVLGTFTPAGILSSFTPGPMSETISYTETDTANGATISTSFSFSGTSASPPSAVVPEPNSLLLFSSGVLAVMMLRQRQRPSRLAA